MNGKLEFVPIGREPITIGGFKVSGIYVADTDPGVELPGFMVNRNLAVDSSSREPLPMEGSDRYADLSAGQRATLLAWMSDANRNQQSHPVGLWALRFLVRTNERRLLVDNDNDANLATALGNLLQGYPTTLTTTEVPVWITSLFHHWANRFGQEYYFQFWNWAKGLPLIVWRQDDLQFWLNNLVAVGRPLQAEQAFHVACLIRNPGAADGDQQETEKIWVAFQKCFDKQFPGGLQLKLPNSQTRLLYQPTDPYTDRALASHNFQPWMDVADFFKERGQFSSLTQMLQPGPAKPGPKPFRSQGAQTTTPKEDFFEEVVVPGTGQSSTPTDPVEPGDRSTGRADRAGEDSMHKLAAELAVARVRAVEQEARLRTLVGEEFLPKENTTLPRDIRDKLLSSLAEGYTPMNLAAMFNVGRAAEIEVLAADPEQIRQGNSVFRAILANSGEGKSHLRNLLMLLAKDFLISPLEMKPAFRLAAPSEGFNELVRATMAGLEVSSESRQIGIEPVLKLIAARMLPLRNGTSGTMDGLQADILDLAPELRNTTAGNDVATVVGLYLRAQVTGNRSLSNSAQLWFSAGYKSNLAARKALGVHSTFSPGDVCELLRILSALAKLAHLNGALVLIDEFSMLINRTIGPVREANFDALLGVINAHAQGGLPGVGLVLFGTEDLMNSRRGLLSHESLRTRLEPTNAIEQPGSGAAIRLSPLTAAELLLLMAKIRDRVLPDELRARLPDEALMDFLGSKLKKLGARKRITPRYVLRPLAGYLASVLSNPEWNWQKDLRQEPS